MFQDSGSLEVHGVKLRPENKPNVEVLKVKSSSQGTTGFYAFKPNEPADQFPVQIEAFILDGFFFIQAGQQEHKTENPSHVSDISALTVSLK